MKRLSIVALLVMLAAGFAACGNVPVINAIRPGHAMPGEVVEIVGSNFGGKQGAGYVAIGKTAVANEHILEWKADSIKMRVPTTAPTGTTFIQLTTDGDLPSNKKKFTIDPEGAAGTKTVVVGNRSRSTLEVYNVEPGAPMAYSLDLNAPGAATTLRGLAASASHQKVFASIVRRSAAGEETSGLLTFGGASGDVTAPALIDVGVQPTGLAVSPDGNRVYVAATASGMLTVVNAVDNSVIADLTVDLGALSYGFEPLYVQAYESPVTTDSADWVSVAGNNWFLGRTEIVTYAPNTTQPIVSVIAIDGVTLQAPPAVSGATGQAWVAGERAGAVAVALLDLAHGRVSDLQSFGAGLTLAGFAGAVTSVSDVAADPVAAKVYLALPDAGIAALSMTTDSTLAPEAALLPVAGPYRLLTLEGSDGSAATLLVTRPAAGAVAHLAADGTVTAEYFKTAHEPTEIAAFPTIAK